MENPPPFPQGFPAAVGSMVVARPSVGRGSVVGRSSIIVGWVAGLRSSVVHQSSTVGEGCARAHAHTNIHPGRLCSIKLGLGSMCVCVSLSLAHHPRLGSGRQPPDVAGAAKRRERASGSFAWKRRRRAKRRKGRSCKEIRSGSAPAALGPIRPILGSGRQAVNTPCD